MQRESLVQQRAAIQMQWRDVYLLAASPAESEEKLTLFSRCCFRIHLPVLSTGNPQLRGRDGADIGLGCYPADVCPVGGSGMNVSRFSLSAEGTELLLTLKLERLNDG
jgi:pilus assembly protein HofO